MLKILIAEDEEPIANLIRMNLKKAGYSCQCVYDGEAASNLLEKERFDLLLLDIMLPRISGYEVMEYAKSLDVPVIFITAMSSISQRVAGLKMGAEDYIVKPLEIVELLARVEAVLRRCQKIGKQIRVLDVEIDEKGAMELARRSRGTPRLANRLLKRVRDFAQVKYDGRITEQVAVFALDLLEVDRKGLDQSDRMILRTIIEKFAGGPVGLDTLAAALGEDAGTLEDVYEPYLLQNGFLNRTARGRTATEQAYRHLGIAFPG